VYRILYRFLEFPHFVRRLSLRRWAWDAVNNMHSEVLNRAATVPWPVAGHWRLGS